MQYMDANAFFLNYQLFLCIQVSFINCEACVDEISLFQHSQNKIDTAGILNPF